MDAGVQLAAPDIRLSICIQTHPARAALLTRLLVSLSPTNVLVAHDPEPEARPGPLRSYVAALKLLPPWATHYLVIQDDAVVCGDFVAALLGAIRAKPTDPLALFVGGALGTHGDRVVQAFERGETFVALSPRSWTPAVALIWPRALVPGFIAYVEEKVKRELADDEVLGRYFRAEKVEVLATVPSLVEHPDDAPSLIGRKTRGTRSAACFVAEGDALAIPWR